MSETLLVLDFGGHSGEQVARIARNNRIYSEVWPGETSAGKLKELSPIGIILGGGRPDVCVYKESAPRCDPKIFDLGVPVLGICYGMQLMCQTLGGKVEPCGQGERGGVQTRLSPKSALFKGISETVVSDMYHGDCVSSLPDGFVGTASTAGCPVAACENPDRKLYGVQFHPNAEATEQGREILQNFFFNICHASGDYHLGDYVDREIAKIRDQVGNERVLLALSGGVDSSVCAAILSRAIPGQTVCIFVDHGFMRLNEADEVEAAFAGRDLQFIRVNAQERFLGRLKGVTDPERKRKLVGEEFIRVFEEEAGKLGDIKFLGQGTIYPDVIESGGKHGDTVKSHHNVGGLPENLKFAELVEPLYTLFKNEVREIGRLLGLPASLTERQPFPGPGLSVRVMGEVTKEKLDVLREADRIVLEEFAKLRDRPQQYFAIYTGARSTGVRDGRRTYGCVIAVRAVATADFMTAKAAEIPYETLRRVSSRIAGEVEGVGRVVYDITDKPPGTVEWE